MATAGSKHKESAPHVVVPRRKGWERHLSALGCATPRDYRQWCRAQGFGPSLHKTWKQRQQEIGRAERLAAREQAVRERAHHVASLGFETVEAYEAWCKAHEFSLALHKNAAQRAKETTAHEQERATRTLATSRHNAPDAFITAIYEQRVSSRALLTTTEQKIHYLFTLVQNCKAQRAALHDLFIVACRYPTLLSLEPAIPYLGPCPGNSYPDGLLELARHRRDWGRPLSEWKPRERRARDLFGSLARHLLAEYPVPAFLDAAFFEGDNGTARRSRGWFLHIGSGNNIRTAERVPLRLTSLAAHHFLRAPRELSIIGAMRWGQTMGMGGSRRLAHAVAASRLRDILPDEDFWETVIRFCVNHSELDATQVGPIVDYIFHQQFEPVIVLDADGEEISTAPANPNFSMKGRTPAALLRLVEEWHRQLAELAKRPERQWAASGIGALHLSMQSAVRHEVTFWTTQELLSSKELEEEGRAMHNCVASYVSSCQERECAIWSLRVWTPHDPTPRRVMTVEICPETRQIVQVRGKCNHCASEPRAPARLKAGMEALRRWAKQEKMTISPGSW